MKKIDILGDGQIWDLRGIDPKKREKIFEDLFSGKALADLAETFDKDYFKTFKKRIFLKFREKGKSKVTGISVTKALLNKKDKFARQAAETLLKDMGKNAALGIELLTRQEADKPGWTDKERRLWKDLTGVIIGAGVSKGKTGRIIISSIKEHLKKRNLSHIKILKAKFPGKEAGFLGAVAYIMDLISKDAVRKKLTRIGAIGLDLGREKIGVGALVINPKTKSIIKEDRRPWIFRYSLKTKRGSNIKDYSTRKTLGLDLRQKIIDRLAYLVCKAKGFLKREGLNYSRHIAVSLPGRTTKDGYIIDSTDYLPFFRKKDGFHFSRVLQVRLVKAGYPGLQIHIINDGIAAGLGNLRFGMGLENLTAGKYAFLGPGSGLGGCLCEIKEVRR